MELFEQFLRAGVYLKGWSPKTPVIYRRAWVSFGGKELTKANLEEWIIRIRGKQSPAGVSIYVRAMNSYLSWLKEEGLITEKPRIKSPKVPIKQIRGFSDQEIRSLLSFRPKGFFELRTFTLIKVLLDTGCRIDEILTLHTVNVDLDNLVLKVQGKGNKQRVVPVSIELRKDLFRYLKFVSGKFVFCTRHGDKLSYRNTFRDIKNLCAKAGVVGSHVHPHAFRHCFAVTYIRRGGDIYRLSRILGHSSISTTQLYLRSMGIEQIGENHSALSPLSRG